MLLLRAARGDPEAVQASVYEDGEHAVAVTCGECLALPEDELRTTMRDYADRLRAWSDDVRASSSGEIRRPPVDVLTLERMFRAPALRFVDRVEG